MHNSKRSLLDLAREDLATARKRDPAARSTASPHAPCPRPPETSPASRSTQPQSSASASSSTTVWEWSSVRRPKLATTSCCSTE